MVFEYSKYYSHTFIVPIISMIIGLVLFLCVLITVISKRDPRGLILGVFVVIAFFIGPLSPFKHGVHLMHEKEDAKIESVGEITDFKIARGDTKNVYQGKITSSCYVYINNEKYYIMYKGDLEVGDEVQFEYLPKSKIILSIEEVDNAE